MAGQTCTIDGRVLQATIKNEPSFDVDVSKHTNEGGASFTDHARPEQEVLALDFINSDIWKGNAPDFGAVSPFEAKNDAQAMFDFLYDLYRNPRPVVVTTPRRTYPALILKSFKPHASDSKFANALNASLGFVEWKTADLKKATIAVSQGKQVKKGTQPSTKPAPPARSAAVATAQAAGAVSSDPADQVIRGADGVLRKPVGQRADGSPIF